jgi:hypothetical protein
MNKQHDVPRKLTVGMKAELIVSILSGLELSEWNEKEYANERLVQHIILAQKEEDI